METPGLFFTTWTGRAAGYGVTRSRPSCPVASIYLGELDANYRPFAQSLRNLAKDYQSKVVSDLLEWAQSLLFSDRLHR